MKKGLDLAVVQTAAQDKTALPDQELALVGVLEEEVSKLKSFSLNPTER